MIVKELLEKLDRFENLLTGYAYDELASQDAVELKQKFEIFKSDLTFKIFNESNTREIENEKINSFLNPQKVFDNAIQTFELLKVFKNNQLPKNQENILHNMELNILVLIELSMSILNKQNTGTYYEH